MFAWYSLLGLLILLIVVYCKLINGCNEDDEDEFGAIIIGGGLVLPPLMCIFIFITAAGPIFLWISIIALIVGLCRNLLQRRWLYAILTIMPSSAIALCYILWTSVPKIIIIEDNQQHSMKIPFTGSFVKDDGTSCYIPMCKCYIYNRSSKDVVVYPVSYGHSTSCATDYGPDPILISSGDFVERERKIKWYFQDAPNTYEVDRGGETLWVLDYVDDALDRLKED